MFMKEALQAKALWRVIAVSDPYNRVAGVLDGRLVEHGPFGHLLTVDPSRIRGEWEQENVIVDLGRANCLDSIVLAESLNFLYMGIGSGTNAELPTQFALQTELTGNANRITIQDYLGNNPPFGASFVQSEISGPYTKKLVVQGTFPGGDGNNGATINEAALFSTSVFATGVMFNRVKFGAGIPKNVGVSLVFICTIRM